MSESSPSYVPTTIAKVFELLDNKLVSLGIPGALALVGITKARESFASQYVKILEEGRARISSSTVKHGEALLGKWNGDREDRPS